MYRRVGINFDGARQAMLMPPSIHTYRDLSLVRLIKRNSNITDLIVLYSSDPTGLTEFLEVIATLLHLRSHPLPLLADVQSLE